MRTLNSIKRGEDLTGRKFGYVEVTGPAGYAVNGNTRRKAWNCRCVCGKEFVLTTEILSRRGEMVPPMSCGCLRKGNAALGHLKGKVEETQLYREWEHLSKEPGTDPEWAKGFWDFWGKVGQTWSKGMYPGRWDPTLPWTEDNFRWQKWAEHPPIDEHDGRAPATVMYGGKEVNLNRLARTLGVGLKTLRYRIERGWPEERWGETTKGRGRKPGPAHSIPKSWGRGAK